MSPSEKQIIEETMDGWRIVMQQGAVIALFPIEEWIEAFDRAETTVPIMDPTLFREYLYSGKGELIKEVLRAALVFKRAILKAQADVLSGKVRDTRSADGHLGAIES